MSDFVNCNELHLNYLTPLLKWRVLDLESLRKEAIHAPKYKNFHRIIRSLEKQKILEGYRNPFNRKKYLYLGAIGEKRLAGSENPTAVSKDTLIHDIRVSEIARELLDQKFVDEIELEHQIYNKRNFRVDSKLIPDAILHFERKGFQYRIALELELTRKSAQRLVQKAKQYIEGNLYHYALYIFRNRTMMNSYIEILNEELGTQNCTRIIFALDDGGPTNLMKGAFKGKDIELKEIFSRNRNGVE